MESFANARPVLFWLFPDVCVITEVKYAVIYCHEFAHFCISICETGCSNCLHSMSICLNLGIMFIAAYFTWFKHVNNMSNFVQFYLLLHLCVMLKPFFI